MTTDSTTPTARIIRQGKALARAIEALDAVAPESWFEHIVVALARTIYIQRLRRLAGIIPQWAMRWVASERGSEPGVDRPTPMVIGGRW